MLASAVMSSIAGKKYSVAAADNGATTRRCFIRCRKSLAVNIPST